MTVADIAAAYTDELRAAIASALSGCQGSDWVSYLRTTSVHAKGRQTFAVFDEAVAYEVSAKHIDADGTSFEICPVVTTDGNFVLEAPDEGRIGLPHLTRFSIRNGESVRDSKWAATLIPFSGLYFAELDMGADEIAERILPKSTLAARC